MTLTRIRLITIWLISLFLMLLAHRLNAQLVERSFYCVQDLTNAQGQVSSNIVYYKVFMSPNVSVTLTHDKTNHAIGMWMQQRSLATNVSAVMAIDGWFGDPDASPMLEYPTLVPYVPPPLTDSQKAALWLSASNRQYDLKHPKVAPAQPKSGNKPTVAKVVKGPPKP